MQWYKTVLVMMLISSPLVDAARGQEQATTAQSSKLNAVMGNLTILARFYDGNALLDPEARLTLARLLHDQFGKVVASITPLEGDLKDKARKLIVEAAKTDNQLENEDDRYLVDHYRAERSYNRIASLLSDLVGQDGKRPKAEMKLWAQLSESLANEQGHKAITSLIKAGLVAPIDRIEGCSSCLAEGRQSIGRTILTSILIPYLSEQANDEFMRKMKQ